METAHPLLLSCEIFYFNFKFNSAVSVTRNHTRTHAMDPREYALAHKRMYVRTRMYAHSRAVAHLWLILNYTK